jgi:protein required for attachment to host cells
MDHAAGSSAAIASSRRICMQTTWIVVADSSRARIFEKAAPKMHLREIEDLVNPSGHAEDKELETDERGRFYGKGEREQGHTAEPAVSAVEHENEKFSRAVTHYLDKAHNEHRYDSLCLIAAPKFLGHLRSSLSKSTKTTVIEELPKDISAFTTKEIETYIKDIPSQKPH